MLCYDVINGYIYYLITGWRLLKLVSHWTDFHVVLYLRIFQQSIEKIQV